jgi:hypothetical protein
MPTPRISSAPPLVFVLVALGVILLVLLSACAEEPAAPTPASAVGFVADRKPPPPVRWGDASIAAGTRFALTIDQELNSATSRSGDRFQARVARAYMKGNRVIIPEGSIIDGVFGEVTPANPGVGNQGGAIVLVFEHIVTPTGADAPIRARPVEVAGGSAILETSAGTAIAAGTEGVEAILNTGTALTIVLEAALDIKVRI